MVCIRRVSLVIDAMVYAYYKYNDKTPIDIDNNVIVYLQEKGQWTFKEIKISFYQGSCAKMHNRKLGFGMRIGDCMEMMFQF